MNLKDFILKLEKIGAVKFGRFTLKSGVISPFYLDLRETVSEPELLNSTADLLLPIIKDLDFDLITGIPYTALPVATLIADRLKKPLIYMRKEEKVYGTGKQIIGSFKKGAKCLVIDDLITTGESKIESAKALEREGLVVKDFVVMIDRSARGEFELMQKGYHLHSLIKLDELVEILSQNNSISTQMAKEVKSFTTSLTHLEPQHGESIDINPLTKLLKEKINSKQSNLVLSLDVVRSEEFFRIIDMVGSEIVMLKTHIDVIEDFDDRFIPRLQEYARKHDFLLFEDRKFADIGNTVRLQYQKGIYRIADWADFVTVHLLPGEGILKGLFGNLEGKSCFVLARMSSEANLLNEAYSRRCLEISRNYPKVVSGFIGHGSSVEDIRGFKRKFPPQTLLLIPGVKLETGNDKLGQRYITVEQAIGGGADCIIVGRGIYQADDPAMIAKKYRERAWQEFNKRTNRS